MLVTAVRLQVGMGHTVAINSSSASELRKPPVVGDKAELNSLIIKLARSGFSWEYLQDISSSHYGILGRTDGC